MRLRTVTYDKERAVAVLFAGQTCGVFRSNRVSGHVLGDRGSDIDAGASVHIWNRRSFAEGSSEQGDGGNGELHVESRSRTLVDGGT